jgi:hypothetical protein
VSCSETGLYPKTGDCQRVNPNSLRNRDIRELGSEWLCYQVIEQLKIFGFLTDLGWSEHDVRLTMTRIISQTVYPASEFCTSRRIKENSSVCELTGYPVYKITKDRLK